MDVVRRNVLEVNFVYLRGDSQIPRHPGRGDAVAERAAGVSLYHGVVGGGGAEVPAAIFAPGGLALAQGVLQALVVHGLHPLHHLKQPRPAGDAVGFEGRGHREADGLLGAGGVGHHEVGGQRVQSPVHALHRGVKALQVNGQIRPLCCHGGPPLSKLQLFILLYQIQRLFSRLKWYKKSLAFVPKMRGILRVITGRVCFFDLQKSSKNVGNMLKNHSGTDDTAPVISAGGGGNSEAAHRLLQQLHVHGLREVGVHSGV